MSLRVLFFAVLFFAQTLLSAQQTFPVPAPSDPREGAFALTNATIYVDYQTRLEGATLLIRKGKIVACGQKVLVPTDAVSIDCSGRTIYPAFIDAYAAGYGLPETKQQGFNPNGKPQPNSNQKGAYAWNEALKTDFNSATVFANDSKAAEEWRKLGFATLATFRADGISRGTAALVSLTDTREHESILVGSTAHHLSFRKGSSTQDFPSSLIGCVALIRQTYIDGQWYKTEGYKSEKNISLDAWNTAQSLPQIFEASDKLDVLRIARIGQEFGVKHIVKTAGDEYQRLEEIKATGQSLIVPLAFPEGYDVRDPFDALNVSLKDLKHWEMAPANPGKVEMAGISFALTAAGLKEKPKFWENLRKAIEYGLTGQAALKALTYNPANFLGVYDKVGSLEAGKMASFIVATGDIFSADTKILQTWASGQMFVVKETTDQLPQNLRGEFGLTLEKDMLYKLFVNSQQDKINAYILNPDSSKTKVNLTLKGNLVTMSFMPDTLKKGITTLSGVVSGNSMSGRGTWPDGRWLDWQATLFAPLLPEKPTKQAPIVTPEIGQVVYPFIAFGKKEKPQAGVYLVKNATVWTNDRVGILKNTDVLIVNGKIQNIGKNLPVQDNATVVDGTGKHLTSGIIDEHSHIAVARSINEGTQESSAEVRIGDALDSEDIDIYRQLAGGVTVAHLLHGSANPIGGQTQLIKLRWGVAPEALKVQNWPGQIKFALGENVKQSNWGDDNVIRFPQTRMGVEQVYVDYFTRAQAYGLLKKSGKTYRKDLELEALLEILESKRFITCHSYVQSEITMLMRVAEKFGFHVNTFTHILEGYKVADKMAKHGVGGSTFSDWWAYKFEVWEAIPQNAKMMTEQGVTVAINSDDAEMARRLNQEAAKSVMYAGMKEEEAWKMVTLNPAKLLKVDDRMGSISKGKDADVVLWNDNPLSVYAKVEKTWVDGIQYFDRQEDIKMQADLQAERARLVQKLLNAKKGGEGGDKPTPVKKHYHCDDQMDEG